MKVKIFDSNNKKYKHKYEFVNNTTADFRYVQPLFCRTMLANARISGTVSQFVRLAPLVYPTFGKLQLKNKAAFTPIEQVFPPFAAFMSQEPYKFQNQSILVKTIPFTTNSFLCRLLIDEFNDQIGIQFTDSIEHFSNPDSSTLTEIRSKYDYYSIQNEPQGGHVQIHCYRLNERGCQLRKIFIGLGYNPSLDDDTKVSFLPVLAFAKSYFDTFVPYRSIDWQDTAAFDLINTFNLFPAVQIGSSYNLDDTDFGLFDDENVALEINGNISNSVTMLADFFKQLSSTMSTHDNDWLGLHTTSVLGNSFSGPRTPSGFYPTEPNDQVLSHTFDSVVYSEQTKGYTDSTNIIRPAFDPADKDGELVSKVPYLSGLFNAFQLRLLQRMTNYVSKDSIIGRRIDSWMRSHLDSATYNNLYNRVIDMGVSSTDINVMDVDATADTLTESAEGAFSGEFLGSYAGKGVGSGKLSFNYKSDTYGFFIVLTWLDVNNNYYQGTDPQLFMLSNTQVPTAEFDALGYEATPRSAVWTDNAISIRFDKYTKQKGNGIATPINDNFGFGFIPRYSGFKTCKDIVNGDFSRNPLRNDLPAFFLNKMLVRRYITTDPKNYVESVDLPVASDLWRYNFPLNWMGNYNRIFYNSGHLFWNDGTEPADPSAKIDDNVLIHNVVDLTEVNSLKPLTESYDTQVTPEDSATSTTPA